MTVPQCALDWAMGTVSYLHLKGDESPPALSLRPFKTIVVAESVVSREWRNAISEWLVRSGCLYFIAWGQACEEWHDNVDEVNLADHHDEIIPDEKFVMTTWHENEPLLEALWFAAICAEHPAVDLDQALIIHIAPREQCAQLLALYDSASDR